MAIDAAALKLLRERSGYSMSVFAKKVGISLQYLCDIEGGNRTLKRSPALIKKMADELQVPSTMLTRGVTELAS